MPPKGKLTQVLENIYDILSKTSVLSATIKGDTMPAIVIQQNEVKSYTIPHDKILYVTEETITSKNIVNIVFFFTTGQNIKVSFSAESGHEAYMRIQEELGAAL